MSESQAKNPKHAAGRLKAATHNIPPCALLYLGAVLDNGEAKYGAYNWGEAGVVASVYDDAINRHLLALRAGEWYDRDSGLPHPAHIMACCAILIDCYELGNLQNDWPAGKTAPIDSILEQIQRIKQNAAPGKPAEGTEE